MQRVCTFLQSHPMAVFYDYISYKGPSYTYCHHSSCFAKGPTALPLGATRSQHPRFEFFLRQQVPATATPERLRLKSGHRTDARLNLEDSTRKTGLQRTLPHCAQLS